MWTSEWLWADRHVRRPPQPLDAELTSKKVFEIILSEDLYSTVLVECDSSSHTRVPLARIQTR